MPVKKRDPCQKQACDIQHCFVGKLMARVLCISRLLINLPNPVDISCDILLENLM